MKPYIICHMGISIDGRIATANWPATETTSTYESTGSSEKADAWMCGRTTMQQHYATELPPPPPPAHRIEKGDFIHITDAPRYVIVLDREGKLGWEKNFIDDDHLIIVLTEKASESYRGYLRGKGISYLVSGKSDIDLAAVLERLNKSFGIKKILLEGGGNINGSFHAAGLIDEYSILIYPVADGTHGPTLLETQLTSNSTIPYQRLTLLQSQTLDGGVVWLKYRVNVSDNLANFGDA